MFSDVKVGDKVYSVIVGWGEVERVFYDSTYPITVRFDLPCGDRIVGSYTLEGYASTNYIFPSLFWDEVVFDIPKKPEYKFKQDEAVICSDFGDGDTFIRYFAYYEKGKPMVYINGHTSKTVNRGSDGSPYVSSFKVTKPILKDIDSGICDKVWGDG